jgi:lipoyl-dependent peroxiredoxin
MTANNALFTTSATAHGGRAGKITTDDGHLNVDLSVPTALGGPGGEGTNPEQLFAAGYAACFQSALGLVARREKIDAGTSRVRGEVGLSRNDAGGYQLLVTLAVALPGVERGVGERLVEQAHQVCPYSNAIRGNVDVQLVLEDA